MNMNIACIVGLVTLGACVSGKTRQASVSTPGICWEFCEQLDKCYLTVFGSKNHTCEELNDHHALKKRELIIKALRYYAKRTMTFQNKLGCRAVLKYFASKGNNITCLQGIRCVRNRFGINEQATHSSDDDRHCDPFKSSCMTRLWTVVHRSDIKYILSGPRIKIIKWMITEMIAFLTRGRGGCNVPRNWTGNLLELACASGSVGLVKYLIDAKGYPMNSPGTGGMPSVFQSAYCGYHHVVKELVHRGCDITVLDKQKNNILHVAAKGGSKEMVRYLISQHLPIEAKNRMGMTALMLAARRGHADVVEMLLDHDARWKELSNKLGMNLLHIASFRGNVDIVKQFVRLGMDINSRTTKTRRTPVMLAAECRNMEALVYLVEQGCDLEAVDRHGQTVLHTACIRGDADIVRYLLSIGVSCKSRDIWKRTPFLSTAYRHGNGSVNVLNVLFLSSCKHSNSDTDIHGYNALQLSCLRSTPNIELTEYLLAIGFPVDYRGRLGLSSAMIAARQGLKELFIFLVQKGCDLTLLSTGHKKNMLHYSCVGGNVDITTYILENTNIGKDGDDGILVDGKQQESKRGCR